MANNPEPSVRAKAIEIPKYWGNLVASSTTPGRLGCLEWLPIFETFMTQNAWADQDAITNASLCFLGEAQTWFVAQRRHLPVDNWAAFRDRFLDRFLKIQTPAERKALQDTLKQGYYDKDESVSAWYDRCCYYFEMLGVQTEEYPPAYDAMTAAQKRAFVNCLTDLRVKDAFVAGLRKDIGQFVTTSTAKTAEELVAAATQAEATLREQRRGRNPYLAGPLAGQTHAVNVADDPLPSGASAVSANLPLENLPSENLSTVSSTVPDDEGSFNKMAAVVQGAVQGAIQQSLGRGRGWRGSRGRGYRGYRGGAQPSAARPCAICGAPTHWKNECPQNQYSRGAQRRGRFQRGSGRGWQRGRGNRASMAADVYDEWEQGTNEAALVESTAVDWCARP